MRHPPQRLKPCRNGANCDKGKDCPFLHPKQKQREETISPQIEDNSVEIDLIEIPRV